MFVWQTWALTALLLLVLTWLTVRVTRWHLENEGVHPVNGEFASFIRTCLYGGLIAISLSAPELIATGWLYFETGFVSFSFGLFRVFAFLGSTSLTIALMLLIGVLTLYIFVRFWIAMPAVMLGHRPNVIRHMWPFAKSIALPFIGVGILYGIGIVVVLFALGLPLLTLGHLVGFPAYLLVQGGINALINVPFCWFGALVFAEAYARLAKARSQPNTE